MAQYSGRRQGRQQRGEESERQEGPSRKGGRTGRGGEKEGGARRGYTPEHVYGQKCESPRLAIVPISDFKDVLIQQVNMRVGLWHNIPLPWHRNLHKDFTSAWLSFN